MFVTVKKPNFEMQPGNTAKAIKFGELAEGRLFWAINNNGQLRRYVKTNQITDCAVCFNAVPLDTQCNMNEGINFTECAMVIVPEERRRWLDYGYVKIDGQTLDKDLALKFGYPKGWNERN